MGIFNGNSIYKNGSGQGIKFAGNIDYNSVIDVENNSYYVANFPDSIIGANTTDLFFNVNCKENENVDIKIELHVEHSVNIHVFSVINGVSIPFEYFNGYTITANGLVLIYRNSYEANNFVNDPLSYKFEKIGQNFYRCKEINGYLYMVEDLREKLGQYQEVSGYYDILWRTTETAKYNGKYYYSWRVIENGRFPLNGFNLIPKDDPNITSLTNADLLSLSEGGNNSSGLNMACNGAILYGFWDNADRMENPQNTDCFTLLTTNNKVFFISKSNLSGNPFLVDNQYNHWYGLRLRKPI